MGTDLNASHAEIADRREVAVAASTTDIPSDIDVLVVGYGPVGATIVNLLGRYGVSTLVVDKDEEIFMAPRAIALDNEALRILQLAGLEDGDFEKVAIPYVRMLSPQLGEFGRINTLGHIDGHPKLVTFYQPELEAALRRRASQYGEVHTALGVALTGFVENADGVVATLDVGDGRTSAVRARYLVGADGASSLVRQLVGQEFTGETYAEDWLVVDACGAERPIDHVEFICDHRRPTPHMTAPGGRERWEFMLRPGETRADMESDAKISDLLDALGRSRGDDDRTQGRLSLSRPHGEGLPQGPGLSRRRRRAHHAALRRSGAGRRFARRGEPVLEDRLGPARPRLAKNPRQL